MYYFIERFDPADIIFKDSDKTLNVNGKFYDVVVSPRTTSLERIASFIISDLNTFDRTKPQFEDIVKNFMKTEYNIEMNELLLG